MDEWSFETWGVEYWQRTEELEAHLRSMEAKE